MQLEEDTQCAGSGFSWTCTSEACNTTAMKYVHVAGKCIWKEWLRIRSSLVLWAKLSNCVHPESHGISLLRLP